MYLVTTKVSVGSYIKELLIMLLKYMYLFFIGFGIYTTN